MSKWVLAHYRYFITVSNKTQRRKKRREGEKKGGERKREREGGEKEGRQIQARTHTHAHAHMSRKPWSGSQDTQLSWLWYFLDPSSLIYKNHE